MKKILITGASDGIGKQIAINYSLKEKATFALFARNCEKLHQVASVLNTNGSITFIYPTDVSNKADFQDKLRLANIQLGGIDLAILNAGISESRWIDEPDYSESLERIYRVNVFGVVYALEFLAQNMNEGSTIAIVSSLADSRGFPSSSAYGSSKAALTKIAEAARVELIRKGIKVITIRPGFIKTNMTEKNNFTMPFLLDAETAAKIIIEGIEKGKRQINFPFGMVCMTKLITALPSAWYESLASLYKRRK